MVDPYGEWTWYSNCLLHSIGGVCSKTITFVVVTFHPFRGQLQYRWPSTGEFVIERQQSSLKTANKQWKHKANIGLGNGQWLVFASTILSHISFPFRMLCIFHLKRKISDFSPMKHVPTIMKLRCIICMYNV